MKLDFNLNTKLTIANISLSLVGIVASLIGLLTVSWLSAGYENNNRYTTLMSAGLNADMMHDAIRGDVYAALLSSDPAVRLSFEDLKKDFSTHAESLRVNIEMVGKAIEDPATAELIAKAKSPLDAYIKVGAAILELARSQPNAAKAQLPELSKSFHELEIAMAEITTQIGVLSVNHGEEEIAQGRQSSFIMLATLLAAVAGSVVLQFFVRRQVINPLLRVSGAIDKLANGDLTVNPDETARADEVGMMARAVVKFRDNELGARKARREEEDMRAKAEEEHRRKADEAIENERALVRDAIGVALEKLASKDLTVRIDEHLPKAYQKLRYDFNEAIETFEQIISKLGNSTMAINSGTQEISSASDDLSRRTEHQAANLEETAAAVAQIAAKMNLTATGAAQAREVVASAKEEAAHSGEIVRKAIDAMNHIEKSSQQITQIIGVIDEIAFQTNLLALNAGVEAARAGESGRGFAVVAQEVRALAQRSADAAKQIKSLIASSHTQVKQGVTLVADTGSSLERIVSRVIQINAVVTDIASGAAEQASSLNQVNNAVEHMDKNTQANAAMVQETSQATRQLAVQSDELHDIIGAFVTNSRVILSKAAGSKSPTKPHVPVKQLAPAAAPRAAEPQLARTGTDNDWTEF